VSNQNVSGNNNIFSQTGDIYYSVSETRSADRVDRANLLLLADKIRTFWISGVLNNSLLGLVAIQLHREGVQDAVEHPWERVLELPQNSVRAQMKIKGKGEFVPRPSGISRIFKPPLDLA
jgi:hypothetical protein